MDISALTNESIVPLMSEMVIETTELKSSDDQYFLLYLIMGTYFGPDLREENPKKCAFQRLIEALPAYTADKLSNSHIGADQIEHIYYYVLRKADKSVTVKQEWLHQFFHGNLPSPEKYFGSGSSLLCPQFPDLFPPQLHPYSGVKSQYGTIQNIVFVNNPAVHYFRPEIIDKFKRLTGLEDFVLDRDEAMRHAHIGDEHLDNVMDGEFKINGELVVVEEAKSDGEVTNALSPSKGSLPHGNNGRENGNICGEPMMYIDVASLPFEPGMVFLPSPPTSKDWEKIVTATRGGFALTGTAAMGQMGPVVGPLDIGDCNDSYLFRVSLPGVIRDERDFGCEVESDGKVMIRGVTTTGEKKVNRYSQEFEMQTLNLCPPGDFSISFYLPGPVDPQQFSGNFGTDGILEGIVVKAVKKKIVQHVSMYICS